MREPVSQAMAMLMLAGGSAAFQLSRHCGCTAAASVERWRHSPLFPSTTINTSTSPRGVPVLRAQGDPPRVPLPDLAQVWCDVRYARCVDGKIGSVLLGGCSFQGREPFARARAVQRE